MWSKKNASLLSIGVVLVSIVLATGARFLEFDSDFDRYFLPDDPEFRFYKDFEAQFSDGQEPNILILRSPSGIMNSEVLTSLDILTEELKDVGVVLSVNSLTTLEYLVKAPMGYITIPYVHPEDQERMKSDSIRIARSDQIVGTLVGRDFTSTAIQFTTDYSLDYQDIESLKTEIDSLANKNGFKEYNVIGRNFSVSKFTILIQNEMVLFAGIAFVVVVLALIILYRRIWDVLAPILIVLFSGSLLVGIMGLSGLKIDLLSSLLPALVFVIGVADVIHINTHFRELIAKGVEKSEAIGLAIKEVGFATFLTSLTTSIGFLSLLLSDIPAVRQFGAFAAVGVTLAFLLSITLFPALLVFIPKPRQSKRQFSMSKILHGMFRMVIHRRGTIVLTSSILVLICMYSITLIKADNYLAEDLPSNDPVKKAFVFYEEQYGGVRIYELAIKTKTNGLSYESMKELDLIENYVSTQFEGGSVASLAGGIKLLHQASNGGNPATFTFPDSIEYKNLQSGLRRLIRGGRVDAVYNEESGDLRLFARIPDFGGNEMRQKNREFQEFVDTKLSHLTVTPTGLPHLIDVYNEKVAFDMLYAIGIAVLVVGLLMGLLFRNLGILIAAFLANLIPLLLVAAIMGVSGIHLNISTALIFTVAFGISVDDSIHILSRVKLERQKGRSLIYSSKRSFISTGRALVFTSLIISMGFLGLIFSSFGSTYYFGLLTCICILVALIADLYLLPLLVIWLGKRKG